MNCFLQCRRQIFMSLSFFAEKVILVLNAQNHFFRASKTPILCLVQISNWWECEAQMLKSFFLSQKKLLNAILRAKLNYMKNILSNEMNCFLQCRRQIFMSLSFFAEKVILELKCTKITSLELLRTPILCLVQISKLWECEVTDAQKLLSQSEKVAKCNFKSKAQLHEKWFFLMKWTVFCNAEDRFSWVWAFLQKKSF